MPPSSASTTRRENIVVNETIIRGTIRGEHLQRLFFLIRSLCPEFGNEGKFHDHDRVYTPSPETRAAKNSIRLRKRIQPTAFRQHHSELEYVLLTYGLPDRRVPALCERRPVSSVAVGREAPDFLTAIGCVMKYEYVRSGVRFRARAGFTIDVYTVKKLQQPGNPNSAVEMHDKDKHFIVDVVSDGGVPPEQLMAFMQHLEPMVVVPTGRR